MAPVINTGGECVSFSEELLFHLVHLIPILGLLRYHSIKKGTPKGSLDQLSNWIQPIDGARRATGVDSADAKSNGKLWAFLSCITSIPRLARFKTSAQVGTTLP